MKYMKIVKITKRNLINGISLQIVLSLIIISFITSCISFSEFYSIGSYKKRLIDCNEFIKYTGPYWINDSIGENGFRRFTSFDIVNNCDCSKQNYLSWDTFKHYMGNPNFSYNYVSKKHFGYMLAVSEKGYFQGSNLIISVDNNSNSIIEIYEQYPAGIQWKFDNYWINNKMVIISPDSRKHIRNKDW